MAKPYKTITFRYSEDVECYETDDRYSEMSLCMPELGDFVELPLDEFGIPPAIIDVEIYLRPGNNRLLVTNHVGEFDDLYIDNVRVDLDLEMLEFIDELCKEIKKNQFYVKIKYEENDYDEENTTLN